MPLEYMNAARRDAHLLLSAGLRKCDLIEAQAYGDNLEDMVAAGIRQSTDAFAIYEDGAIIAVGGCVVVSQTQGCPWFLGTDRVADYPITLARGIRSYTDKWLTQFKVLENFVHAQNLPAIKALKFAGYEFPVRPEDSLKISELLFIRFRKVAPCASE